MFFLRRLPALGALVSVALTAGCGDDGSDPAGSATGATGPAAAEEREAPEDQLAGRGEVLELEHDHLRVWIVNAAYDPNPPGADPFGEPAEVGFTYLQLLLRFETIPEDRGVEPPRYVASLQLDYPECEEAYDRNPSEVSLCMSGLGMPDTTVYQTAEQLMSDSWHEEVDVFDPGVPYFATYYYTVDEELLPTDPQLCYVENVDLDDTPEGCIPIGEIES